MIEENKNENILKNKIELFDSICSDNSILDTHSKPVIEKSKKKQFTNRHSQKEISYHHFIKKEILLNKYKIPDLKKAAKSFKLPITGSKPVLINRIELYFYKIKSVILIQSQFRKWLVLHSFSLRGPAWKNRSLCVNDTDFVTMEPLPEIAMENFFSYTDEKQFTYGFNVVSLVKMMQDKTRITNPYNREKISSKMVFNIQTLYNISYILYEEFRKENMDCNNKHKPVYNYTRTSNRLAPLENILEPQPRVYNLETDYIPRVHNVQILLNREHYNRYHKINTIRTTKTVIQRIEELFMEIDQLGNYTQSSWFLNLDGRAYTRLYRSLYDIWNYRSQMSEETRRKISPFYSPFEGIFNRQINTMNMDLNQIKVACLIAMENMIYSGIDEDYRKIGAFHALSALTIVSHSARIAMPWLYDSVVY
jgi:hypothetical protein